MIKALCASLLLSATSSLGAVELPDYYTPAVSDVDLSVVVDGETYQRLFYNDSAYIQFDNSTYSDVLFAFAPDNYFSFLDDTFAYLKTVGMVFDSTYDAFDFDWNTLYFWIDGGVFYDDDCLLQEGFCLSYWYSTPEDGYVYYYEILQTADDRLINGYAIDVSSSIFVLDDVFHQFTSRGVLPGDSFHFDPLPANVYDFLVQQEEYDVHPVLPRTQPKLPPDAVTNQDFNLWNTVRDFYVRFLFGGTDSQGTVYNKASFGSVPTSSFNVDVGDNSVSMGDWLSSTLTIITFALFVLVIVLLIRWIAVSIGNAVLGVSGR